MDKKFIKKIMIYFIGNMSTKLISVLLIPLYAYFITTEELGQFDYSQTIMNIIVPIIFMNMHDSILRFILQKKAESKEKVYSNALILIIFNILITFIIYILFRTILSSQISYLKTVIIMVITNGFAQFWQYCARAEEENRIYVISGIYSSITNLVLIIILNIIFNFGLVGLYISYISSQIMVCIILERKLNIIKKFKIKYLDFYLLKKMLVFSLPLMINIVSSWFNTGVSKIIIANNLGAFFNGLYSFGNRFAIIITTIGSVMGMAIIEEAYLTDGIENYAKRFSVIINKLFYLYLSIVMLVSPIIFILFRIFFKSTDYYQSKNIIVLLMLYSVFTTISSSLGSAFQVTGKTKYIFVTTSISAFVASVGSILIYNKFGLFGIVCIQLLAGLIMLLTRAIIAYKLTGLRIKYNVISVMSISILMINFLGSFESLILEVIMLIYSIIFTIIVNRNEILKIYKNLNQLKY